MNKVVSHVINILSCVFIVVAVILCSIETMGSVINSTLLGDISLSLKSDFLRNLSLSYKCLSDESPINLGFWPGTVRGCDCLGIRSSRVSWNRRNKLNRGSCSINETRAGCGSVRSIPQTNYTFWRSKQFCSKEPIETNNELKYLDYLKNSVKKGEPCSEGYKQCGILDTLNNVLCLAENETCPLNFFIITNTENPPSEYENITVHTLNFYDGHYVHYSNEAINNSIIVDFEIAERDHLCIESNEKYSTYYYTLDEQSGNCDTAYNEIRYDTRYTLIDSIKKEQLFLDNFIYDKLYYLPRYNYQHLAVTNASLYMRSYLGFTKEAVHAISLTPANNKYLYNSTGFMIAITVLVWVSFGMNIFFYVVDVNRIDGIARIITLICKGLFIIMGGFIYWSFVSSTSNMNKIILPEHNTSDILSEYKFDAIKNKIILAQNLMISTIAFYSATLVLFILRFISKIEHYTGMDIHVPLIGSSYEMSSY
jgi:hypothetical protein